MAAPVELKIAGWPRGWKQFRSRNRLMIFKPRRKEATWTLATDIPGRRDWRNGITVEQFRAELDEWFVGHVRSHAETMRLLGVGKKKR